MPAGVVAGMLLALRRGQLRRCDFGLALLGLVGPRRSRWLLRVLVMGRLRYMAWCWWARRPARLSWAACWWVGHVGVRLGRRG